MGKKSKKSMPMVNTTLGPTSVAGETDITSTFNSGGVGHANGHSICLLSSTDGERWEKVIEASLNGMDDISRCHTRCTVS